MVMAVVVAVMFVVLNTADGTACDKLIPQICGEARLARFVPGPLVVVWTHNSGRLDCKEVVVESVSEGQSDLAKAPMLAIVVNEIVVVNLLQHQDVFHGEVGIFNQRTAALIGDR